MDDICTNVCEREFKYKSSNVYIICMHNMVCSSTIQMLIQFLTMASIGSWSVS